MFLTKQNSKKIKPVFIFSILFLLVVVMQQSCKKTDSNGMVKNDPKAVAKFLTAPPNTNPTVNRIINAIKNQEERYHFLNGIIANEGYAMWQNAQIMTGPGSPIIGSGAPVPSPGGQVTDTIVLIPLVLANTSYVNSFISCKVDDTVTIKLHKGREYASYGFNKSPDSINAEQIALTCMDLEYQTFNHSKFIIKDKRLLNFRPDGREPSKTILTIRPSTVVSNIWITVIEAYEIEVFNENPFGVECPPGQACQWTHTETRYRSHTYWQGDFGQWAGGDFPDDPWSSTGGQGGGGTYPPCGSNCNPVTGNWEVVNDPLILSTQEQQDLQWMNSNIKDSTNNPCIASTLATLKGISSKLPALLRNIFDTTATEQFNVTLKMYYVNADEGARTAFNVNSFTYVSKINSRFQQATNLAVAATIIHEVFHCQLLAWYRQASVLNDTTKRNELARNYGYLFSKESIDYDNNLAAIVYNSMGASQHQDIAIRYRNMIGETLYQFALAKGINVDLEFCKDLAWTGCQDSRAFNDLGQTSSGAIQQLINSEKDPFGSIGVNGVPDSQKGVPCL